MWVVSKKNVTELYQLRDWLIVFVLCYLWPVGHSAEKLFAANGDYERDSFRRGGCHRGPLRSDAAYVLFGLGHCCPGWGRRELITGTGDYANRQRREGLDAFAAISKAGGGSIPTHYFDVSNHVCGLIPLMTTTTPATGPFLPIAISLAWGVLFATVITLLLVPCLYMMIEDLMAQRDKLVRAVSQLFRKQTSVTPGLTGTLCGHLCEDPPPQVAVTG